MVSNANNYAQNDTMAFFSCQDHGEQVKMDFDIRTKQKCGCKDTKKPAIKLCRFLLKSKDAVRFLTFGFQTMNIHAQYALIMRAA